MKRWRRNNFSLIELLVALSILSVLLLLFMQFFSGASKAMASANGRNKIYADARVAFDYIENALLNADQESVETLLTGKSEGVTPVDNSTFKFSAAIGQSYGDVAFWFEAGSSDEGFPYPLKALLPGTTEGSNMIYNVTNFKVTGYDKDFAVLTGTAVLAYVKLELTLLSDDDIVTWKDLSAAKKTDFVKQNGYTVSRIVMMPDALGQREEK